MMNSNENLGIGYLIVRVTTARGAIPLEGARVNVRSGVGSATEERGELLYSLVSDSSGNTERISLPAPPKGDSVVPNGGVPYASYHLEVFREGYYTHQYLGVPIFDGITAVQTADMIPKSESGKTGYDAPDEDLYFNTPPAENGL